MTKTMNKKKLRNTLSTITVLVVLFVITIIIDKGRSLTMKANVNKIIIFAIAALALNLVCGNLGELVLGHGGFLLIGFVVALLMTNYVIFPILEKSMTNAEIYKLVYFPRTGIHIYGYLFVILNVLLAGIITGLIGFLVGLIVLGRLKGDYLAIVTLGFGLMFVALVQNIVPNGAQSLDAAGKIAGNTPLFFVFFVIILFMLTMFIKSRFGRAIISIREDSIAAEASGIPVRKYKVMSFAISAGIAGIAGALYCHLGPQSANQFNQDLSIEILLMIVLGGLGSYTGTLIAVPMLVLLNQYILVAVLPDQFTNNPKIIYGILLIAIMLFKPKGIMGTKEFSWNWFYSIPQKFKECRANKKACKMRRKGGDK